MTIYNLTPTTLKVTAMYAGQVTFKVKVKPSQQTEEFIEIILNNALNNSINVLTALSYETGNSRVTVFDMFDIMTTKIPAKVSAFLIQFEETFNFTHYSPKTIQEYARVIHELVRKEYDQNRLYNGLPNIDIPLGAILANRVVKVQETSPEPELVPITSQEQVESLAQSSIPEVEDVVGKVEESQTLSPGVSFDEDKSSPSSKLKEIQQLVGDLECEEKDVLNKAMLKLAGFLLKEEGKTDILMQISSMKDVDFTTSILETLFKCKEFEFARKTTLKEALGLDNIPTYNNMVVNNLLEREFKNMPVDVSNMHLDEIMEKHPEVFERVSEELNATFGQRVRKEDLTTLIKSGREVSIEEMLGFVTGPDSVVGSQLRGNKPTDVTATVTTQQVNGIAAAVKDAFPSGKKPKYSHSVKPNINKTVKN